jgi:hypothetical protein
VDRLGAAQRAVRVWIFSGIILTSAGTSVYILGRDSDNYRAYGTGFWIVTVSVFACYFLALMSFVMTMIARTRYQRIRTGSSFTAPPRSPSSKTQRRDHDDCDEPPRVQ